MRLVAALALGALASLPALAAAQPAPAEGGDGVAVGADDASDRVEGQPEGAPDADGPGAEAEGAPDADGPGAEAEGTTPPDGGGDFADLEGAPDADAGEFVDPGAGEDETPAPVPAAPYVPPPLRPPEAIEATPEATRRPPVMDPPRRANVWSLGGSSLVFFPTSAAGLGLLIDAHVVYRFEAPMMVRADLMPLGLSFGEDGRGRSGFGLLSFGLDLHAFGLSLGVGAVSNNEHDANTFTPPTDPEPDSGAMVAIVPTVRIGVSDGVRLRLWAGVAIDAADGASHLAVFAGDGQIPFDPRWAMTFRGGWSMSGYAEARIGMRVWLLGLGGPGSLALRLDGGLGRVVYHAPLRARGYPDAVDHVGPGFGFGLEGRL